MRRPPSYAETEDTGPIRAPDLKEDSDADRPADAGPSSRRPRRRVPHVAAPGRRVADQSRPVRTATQRGTRQLRGVPLPDIGTADARTPSGHPHGKLSGSRGADPQAARIAHSRVTAVVNACAGGVP